MGLALLCMLDAILCGDGGSGPECNLQDEHISGVAEPTCAILTGKEKSIRHHHGNRPFFSFSGSEALWCIPFFLDLWCITLFPCFPRKMVYT